MVSSTDVTQPTRAPVLAHRRISAYWRGVGLLPGTFTSIFTVRPPTDASMSGCPPWNLDWWTLRARPRSSPFK